MLEGDPYLSCVADHITGFLVCLSVIVSDGLEGSTAPLRHKNMEG
jgi:hypothetical protein